MTDGQSLTSALLAWGQNVE